MLPLAQSRKKILQNVNDLLGSKKKTSQIMDLMTNLGCKNVNKVNISKWLQSNSNDSIYE